VLVLTCMTSRFKSVCHRERGRRVSVTSSPSSCGGVEKTSTGTSWVVSAARLSMTTKMLNIRCQCARQKKLAFFFCNALHRRQRNLLYIFIRNSVKCKVGKLCTIRPINSLLSCYSLIQILPPTIDISQRYPRVQWPESHQSARMKYL